MGSEISRCPPVNNTGNAPCRAAGLQAWLAALAFVGVLSHLVLRYGIRSPAWQDGPLWAVLAVGGIPLMLGLLRRIVRGELGSDLLAGIAIGTSFWMGEYLAGTVVILMLSGGQAIEAYALGRASALLGVLAQRTPSLAHRKVGSELKDLPVSDIRIDDLLVMFPHELAPVDGVVVEGHGRMDESYLTGEPYQISKVPGSQVLSGAINGESSLSYRAGKLAQDSRYAKIMSVLKDSEQRRPRMRRLADTLGAIYTPVALALAGVAWWISGEPRRFLAVLVVATPCPLLIAIPVAIIGAISLAARRGIIIKDPAVLEQAGRCRTMILDKTGTLTYGQPRLTSVQPLAGFEHRQVLGWAASLERYSRHPLASAVLSAAHQAGLVDQETEEIQELPGHGMKGIVQGVKLSLGSRKALSPAQQAKLPKAQSGLEALLTVDGQPAACFHFHDQPRPGTRSFLQHLHQNHRFRKLMIVSGDRPQEVQFLAEQIGMGSAPDAIRSVTTKLHAGQSPEQKVALVRLETALQPTLYLGDGINDAPALSAATVGLAMGQNSDLVTESAGAVILDSSLRKVDEFLHISRRMQRIALQSAVGGMALSVMGMGWAAVGRLTPLQGAVLQEMIDVLAILNALRVGMPPGRLTDYQAGAETRAPAAPRARRALHVGYAVGGKDD